MQTKERTGNLQAMTALGAEWWNDSCDPEHLAEAVAQGATGATSNPVIVETVVSSNQERWLPAVRQLAAHEPSASAEEVTWQLIHEMGRQSAEILRPEFEASEGARGYLSLQVNPENSEDEKAMFEQACQLAGLADNVAIKVPSTPPGLAVAERLVARGISVNTTVSFSVAQAVAAAEAIDRGLAAYAEAGNDPSTLHPYVTIMVGRVGDYLRRVAEARGIDAVDDELYIMSGVWVFRRAARIFQERGFGSTLLAAAYRHELQWSQIIGPNVLQSIPYGYWTKFQNADCTVRETIHDGEDNEQVQALRELLPEYDLVYRVDGMTSNEFEGFEATQVTVKQFREGYRNLVKLVAENMN
jgi:transaldolase